MSEGDRFEARFDIIDSQLREILGHIDGVQRAQILPGQAWFTTHELAEILGKSRYTISEWCRLGRVEAEKRSSNEWVVAREEVERYRREGLRPNPHQYRHRR